MSAKRHFEQQPHAEVSDSHTEVSEGKTSA